MKELLDAVVKKALDAADFDRGRKHDSNRQQARILRCVLRAS